MIFFENIEVIFHISSSWINIRLHAKHMCPRLSNLYWVPLWCGGFLTDNNTTPTNLFHIVLVVGWVTAFYLPTDEWWGKHVQTGEQRPPNFSVSHTFLTEGVVFGFWNFAHSFKCQKYSFVFSFYNYNLYLFLIL